MYEPISCHAIILPWNVSNTNVPKIVNDLAQWEALRHYNFDLCRLKDDVQKYFSRAELCVHSGRGRHVHACKQRRSFRWNGDIPVCHWLLKFKYSTVSVRVPEIDWELTVNNICIPSPSQTGSFRTVPDAIFNQRRMSWWVKTHTHAVFQSSLTQASPPTSCITVHSASCIVRFRTSEYKNRRG